MYTKFWTFSAWWAGTISRYSTEESLPIKAGRLEAMPHLTTACKRATPFGRSRSSSVGPGRSQQLRILLSLTVRRFSWVCASFCWRQDSVDAIFCRRPYFVDPSILLTPVFCRRQYFVDANILSMSIFCQCGHFCWGIIFCRRWYF
jgi:hypothetical protein